MLINHYCIKCYLAGEGRMDSKEDGGKYAEVLWKLSFLSKLRKKFLETVKLAWRETLEAANRSKSVSFSQKSSIVVLRAKFKRYSWLVVDFLCCWFFDIEPEEQWHKCEITRCSGDKEKQFYLIEFNYVAGRYFFTMEQKNSYRIFYSYCTLIFVCIYYVYLKD